MSSSVERYQRATLFLFVVSIWSLTYYTVDAAPPFRGDESKPGGGAVLNPDERDILNHRPHFDKSENFTRVSGLHVFVNSVLMALASGLGVIPFFFVPQLSKDVIGTAHSIACGVMLACSFDLLHEGQSHSPIYLIIGIVTGMICVKLSHSILQGREDIQFESLAGADAKKILLFLGIMSAHAVGEGAGVGVSYSGQGGWSQGVLVTLAIGLHNIPEGLAVSTVLISRGIPLHRAFLWNVLSALPQAIVALPAFLFVEQFRECLPFAMGFASGCMMWIVFSELLPDAFENISPTKAATLTTLSAAGMEGTRMVIDAIEVGVLFPLDKEATDRFAVLILCMIACSAASALVKYKIPLTNTSEATGIGLQFVCSLFLLFHQLFSSGMLLLPTSLWISIGSVVAVIDWKQAFCRVMPSGRRSPFDENTYCLPTMQKLMSDTEKGWAQFVHQSNASRLLCGLVGIGILGGVRMGQKWSFSDGVVSSVLLTTVIKASFFGVLTGLWRIRHKKAEITMTAFLIMGIPFVIFLPSSDLLDKVSAVISGALVVNAFHLLLCRPSPISASSREKARNCTLETISEAEAVILDVPIKRSQQNNVIADRYLYHCAGMVLGMALGSLSLILLAVFCV